MYDKNKCKAVGVALVELVEAVTTDGVGMDDMDELMVLVAALKSAQAEMATDTDAAVLHILSGASDAFGDKRVNPALPVQP